MASKLIVLFVLCCTCVSGKEQYIVATFEGLKERGIFNKLVVNYETNELYLGAVNYLYKLSHNLDKIQEVKTGPLLDDPNCSSITNLTCDNGNCKCELMEYYTKALVIDYTNGKLVACSTLYHGHCEKRNLTDITSKYNFSFIPMVANNEVSSTVMFIAPGPPVESFEPQRQVLYVAASYTNRGFKAYREKVPAFCSRSLGDFKLLLASTFRSSAIEIESQHRDTFPVHYIYGFGSENFSYVLTIQKTNVQTSRYVTKMLRVCQNDLKYYSYAEVGLSCMYQNTRYNLVQAAYVGKSSIKLARSLGIPTTEDVLYAVFSLSDTNSNAPTAQTAMCVYTMRNIRKKFTENIQTCFNGVGNTGPGHIISSSDCLKVDTVILDDFCGEEYNFPISGHDDITTEAVLRFPNTYVTALITATTYNYTVAFVGTKSGHIKKVVVENEKVASEYKDITVEEGSRIYSDLRLDENEQYLYAVTERKVTKLKVHDCGQYTTCYDCLGAKDPYCGWCSFEDKCSPMKECQMQDTTMRWLSYSGKQCTNITHVIPDKIQKGRGIKTQELRVFIEFLPHIENNDLQCVFSSYDNGNLNRHRYIIQTVGRSMIQEDGVFCETPTPNRLPPIPTGKDHIVMKLAVQSKFKDVVSTNFTFFDCSLHTSCTRCTISNFPCTWCVQSHICTYEPDQECQNQKLVTGSQRPGKTFAPGPKSCPKIKFVNNKTKILVPANTKDKIKVQGINLYDFQMKNGIKCFFNIKDGVKVSARVGNITDTIVDITCDDVLFDFIHNSKSQNVPFEIFWDTDKPLDNPSNIQVMMYKCEVMASSCGECLALEEQYKCGWCVNRCSTQRWCNDKKATWLPATTSVCPNPKILTISPTSGPLAGGTSLTIEGQDLGQTKPDVTVEIGNRECDIVSFTAPRRLVCKTPRFTGEQTVYVNILNRYKTSGLHFFNYVKPIIKKIYPAKGPLSGGTRVTISGDYMNAGSGAIVTIGQLSCQIEMERLKESELICTTTEAKEESVNQKLSVSVAIDMEDVEIQGRVQYTYVSDPTIVGIDPKKTIQAGGLSITVYGTDFTSIAAPTMLFPDDDNPEESPCEVKTETRMICQSPRLQFTVGKKEEVSYGFRMDGVRDLLNLTAEYQDFGTFQVFPNPVFFPFANGEKSHQNKNQYLTINGNNLNVAVEKNEVKVKIGKEDCNVTSVADEQLTCTPPKSEPAALVGDGPPKVVVFVGANFSSTIGLLRYEEADGLSLHAIIAISVGAAILVIAVIVVCIAYLVKSRRSDDMMKKMRIQMDSLESRVANECKEAFAELQTDMTELTSDHVGQVSIPFWEYRTFCMKVLFPGQEDHMVVRELEVEHNHDNIERGLQQFFQLISNKTFLLILIRTLESNRSFQLKDRVNVASLISVALQTKMEYATDILKTLLADLIEKSVEGQGQKNHPKLLLRRNESVAEKMLTNWFTFLLYRYMKECAGEPLFMLYQAMKQQVSKGPVDAITSEARYSLSEDKLIRQQINFKIMTVHVVDVDSFPQQTHPVKVLDCDTISQVKEKILDAIYKNAAFSCRPLKDQLDLEWLCPPNEKIQSYLPSHKDTHRLVLHDEDQTSKMDNDCRRLNTLLHYKVPDGAYVAFEAKNTGTYNSSIISEKSMKYGDNFSFYNRSPSLNRTTSPQSIHVDVDNVKSYHLVRQHDPDILKEGDRGSKMVSEIYLPRLLVTKGTLQQFVDDLFERIFSTAHRGSALPLAIKYMFDFLDDQALLHNIQDNETVHTWKSNSLPLRFWVNVMKNPNFVFDIYKSNIVDSCLSVVAQTFMDSCSVHEHVLGKDSPSSKLLYAKDIPKYKQWVDRYYQDIKMMPAISDQDMTAMLTEESRLHHDEFNTNAALYELYKYVCKNYNELKASLDEDEFAKRSKLRYKLEKVKAAMDGDAEC